MSWKALGELTPYQSRPDVVICHKSALEDHGLLVMARRCARAGTVFCADVVDGKPKQRRRIRKILRSYICASRSEFDWPSSRGERCYFAPHHVDLRIMPMRRQRSNFAIRYLGQRRNAQHPETIKLEVLEGSPDIFETAHRSLRDFLSGHSHHYSIRSYSRGLQATHQNLLGLARRALAIVSREDTESLRAVGADYPYLSGSSRYSEVAETVLFAEETLGMREHASAVQAMEELRRKFCPARVVKLLHFALREEMLREGLFSQHR